tara:strand:- start:1243 stop:1710 length:468 start_codon:yes stop_codon:yes gene_type:complete
MKKDVEYYMNQCINLGEKALANGNPPVGAIVLYKGNVIGYGMESVKPNHDITNHAEIIAIRQAIKKGYLNKLHLTSLYTTHEPCIMCSYVIRHHRISEIIYGTDVPYVGGCTSHFNILDSDKIPKWGSNPKVVSGICLDKCDELNEKFLEILNKP